MSWNDQYMDNDSSDDELLAGVAADDPNKFEVLCDGVLNTIALVHESLHGFLEVKDILLHHHLPPSVLLSLSIASSKLFRRYVMLLLTNCTISHGKAGNMLLRNNKIGLYLCRVN